VNWLVHIAGIDDPAGRWYLFWSGIGANLGELSVLAGIVSLYRKHTCHLDRCWRIGKYRHGEWLLCRRHHPEDKLTVEDVNG
jgi:hypothetical protein